VNDRQPSPFAGRKEEVRQLLLDYFAACPTAMDTLDVIAEFWLPRQRIRTDVVLLREVVAELADEGVLEIVASGAVHRYRLKISSRLP
jgi:hypothetical protein